MTKRSPSWYRLRGLFVLASLGIGVVMGPGVSRAIGLPADPTYVVVGRLIGALGVEPSIFAAALLTLANCAIRAWASAYLGAATVWSPDARGERLIVQGPFRFLRHPIYFGDLLLAIGFGALAPPVGEAFACCGVSAVVWLAIGEEERVLRMRHGRRFDAYRHAVPTLFPRLGNAAVDGSVSVTPSGLEALAANIAPAAFAVVPCWILVLGEGRFEVFALIVAVGWLLQLAIIRFEVQ